MTAAVIFDMDGVLVDSEVIAAEIESEMFTALGVPISVEEIYEHFVGLSLQSVIEVLRRDWNLELPASFLAERQARIVQRFDEVGRAIPGIDGILGDLVAHDVPCAVASSSLPESIDHKLAATGLARYFGQHVYSATMVPRGKPAPDLFLHAARQLGVSPTECVVVEDATHGVQAGCAAHMTVIGFTAGGHCGPGTARQLEAAGAHEIVATADQLRAVLTARFGD